MQNNAIDAIDVVQKKYDDATISEMQREQLLTKISYSASLIIIIF